jgi:hypothetical protein
MNLANSGDAFDREDSRVTTMRVNVMISLGVLGVLGGLGGKLDLYAENF